MNVDVDIDRNAISVEDSMMENDPTVECNSMVVANPCRLSLANCNSVMYDNVYTLPIFDNIDDSSGLPLLTVKVNNKCCTILLDSGSKLNLVSK